MFSTYVNLGPRKKVRIHRLDCKEVRKNGVENEKHFWVDDATLDEAIATAEKFAATHNLSPWTANRCRCGINGLMKNEI